MFKIEVKDYKQFDTLGTEFLDGKLIVYGYGYDKFTLAFSINGIVVGEHTYETESNGRSFFKISMNEDEVVILEEPTTTDTFNEIVLVPDTPRLPNRREIGILFVPRR